MATLWSASTAPSIPAGQMARPPSGASCPKRSAGQGGVRCAARTFESRHAAAAGVSFRCTPPQKPLAQERRRRFRLVHGPPPTLSAGHHPPDPRRIHRSLPSPTLIMATAVSCSSILRCHHLGRVVATGGFQTQGLHYICNIPFGRPAKNGSVHCRAGAIAGMEIAAFSVQFIQPTHGDFGMLDGAEGAAWPSISGARSRISCCRWGR